MIESLEQKVAEYLDERSGPLRVERISARVFGIEWQDVTAEDRGRIIRAVRIAGFKQLSWPLWTRVDPRDGDVTEAEFHALVGYAGRFEAKNGRAPASIRDLVHFLGRDGDADSGRALFARADEPSLESALRCAGFVKAAAA
jgi:hypothetical protein